MWARPPKPRRRREGLSEPRLFGARPPMQPPLSVAPAPPAAPDPIEAREYGGERTGGKTICEEYVL